VLRRLMRLRDENGAEEINEIKGRKLLRKLTRLRDEGNYAWPNIIFLV
jgi:hypothetical protein